jgi:hypothetical protein
MEGAAMSNWWSDPVHEDCGHRASEHVPTTVDDNVVSYECPTTPPPSPPFSERFLSEDGRLSVNLTIEHDGTFYADFMATGVGTRVNAKIDYDTAYVYVNVRGRIEDR